MNVYHWIINVSIGLIGLIFSYCGVALLGQASNWVATHVKSRRLRVAGQFALEVAAEVATMSVGNTAKKAEAVKALTQRINNNNWQSHFSEESIQQIAEFGYQRLKSLQADGGTK